MDIRKSKQGSVLVFILIVMALLRIVLTALANMALTGIKFVNVYKESNSDYYMAELGLKREKFIVSVHLNNIFL